MTKMRVSQADKLRENNKTSWDVIHERDAGKARLLNFSGNQTVEMYWGYNDAMIRDGMFKLKVGKEEVILNAEEFRRFLRWV